MTIVVSIRLRCVLTVMLVHLPLTWRKRLNHSREPLGIHKHRLSASAADHGLIGKLRVLAELGSR